MKKTILCLLISLYVINAYSQSTVQGQRVIATQALYLKNHWLSEVKTDTNSINGATGSIMTADAIYKFVHNRFINAGGTSMVYPGAGIPISNGSGWLSSITDNSGNWNTAFGWGNWASNFGTGSGTIAQGNDTRINNGQTAFGWGNHASANYQTAFGNQTAYAVYNNPTSGSAAPVWSKIKVNSIDATGTPGSSNFLRGDGSWISGALSPWLFDNSDIYYSSGKVGIGYSMSAPASLLHLTTNQLTNTAADSAGLLLENTNAATNNNQRRSLSLRFRSNGWNQVTAASQPIDWDVWAEPTQGNPVGGNLRFSFRSNNGAYSNPITLTSLGGVFCSTITMGVGAALNLTSTANGSAGMAIGGSSHFNNNPSGTTFYSFAGGFTPVSLTGTDVYVAFNPSINVSGTSTGNYEGFRVNVTETSIPTGTNYLARFGTGGGSFSSKFSIKNDGSTVIGTNSAPDASAALDVVGTNKGVLINRMTKTQRNSLPSPAAGLMVIVTGETGGEYLSVYNANQARWEKVNTTAD